MSTSMDRRRFLQGVLASAVAGAIPLATAQQLLAAAPVGPNDPLLLVVELVGGNDALNTIGRFNDGRYNDLRGQLAIPASRSHSLGNGLFAHPRLPNLARRYRAGEVAVVEGVGDHRHDRSHFSGLARWESGLSSGAVGPTGWVGRWLDTRGTDQFGGVAIDPRGLHLAMRGDTLSALTVAPKLSVFDIDRSTQIQQGNRMLLQPLAANGGGWGALAQEQMNATLVSLASSQGLAPAFLPEPPEDETLRDFTLAQRLFQLDLGIRVVSVRMKGFDTHARQVGQDPTTGTHADLLGSLDTGVEAFLSSLPQHIKRRMSILMFSEFGRRPAINGARGTDHGTAGSVLVVGDTVNGGTHGQNPSLVRLDTRGDQLHTVTYQEVLAAVVEDHLGADAAHLLGGRTTPLSGIFAGSTRDGEPPLPGIFARSTRDGEPPVTRDGDLRSRAAQIRAWGERSRDNPRRLHLPKF